MAEIIADTEIAIENDEQSQPKGSILQNQKVFNTPSQSLDQFSPYFLHPSTGVSLVSLKLTEENYLTWRRSIKIALAAKNKLCFVDGNLPRPVDSSLGIAWDRCNNMLLSWILNSMSSDIANSISNVENVREIWIELEERLSQGNGPRIFKLKKAIASPRQENASISSYYTHLKTLWDEMASYVSHTPCDCSTSCAAHRDLASHLQSEKSWQFLMGLGESFTTVRSQILAMNPIPSINKIYSLVQVDEK